MFCRKCGNELREGSRFCGKCGEHVLVDMSTQTYGAVNTSDNRVGKSSMAANLS